MGKISLARIDERLIHGQVMLTLSQRDGVDSIFVVDDVVAKDPFMKDLYKSAGGRTGQKTIVIGTPKAKEYWDKYEFKDYQCILLSKTVETMYDLVKHGLPIEELNVGGISQKKPTDKRVTKAVYINEEHAKMFKDMNENYGVKNIYFQQTPSSEKVSLNDVLKQFNL